MTEATKNEKVRKLVAAKSKRDAPYLLEALRDPEARTIAARYLADIGATEAIPSLMRLLSATDTRTRSAAIKALWSLGAVEALPDLEALAANDASPVVRSHAVGALERLGDPRAIPVLIEALQDSDGAVAWCAATALGSLGDVTAIEPLKAAAKRAHFLRRGAYRKAIRRIRSRKPAPD
jgi:bilin biosynthesis protein